MSVTLNSLPGKFKCSLLNVFFCPDGITLNSGLTGPNNTPRMRERVYKQGFRPSIETRAN